MNLQSDFGYDLIEMLALHGKFPCGIYFFFVLITNAPILYSSPMKAITFPLLS